MMLFREKKRILCCIILVAYIVMLYILGVLNRDPLPTSTIKLELFWGYNNPPKHIFRDNLLNIASFIPIGFMTVLIFTRYRALKAILVGFFMSVIIESSQYIWRRGVCDIDDVFNNAVGALVGCLLAMTVISSLQKTEQKKQIS